MSIVGHGDVASVLPDRDDLLFFASGVSDSSCTDEKQYQREIDLLLDQDGLQHIVYFSSLSVFYSDTRYAEHKRQMEIRIKRFPIWTIIRLGNITWGDNPSTLINYLHAHPEAEIQDTYRYVVGIEEFMHWIDLIPWWSCEMNIPGRMMKVKDIVEAYVR